jgi:hypothetical protein
MPEREFIYISYIETTPEIAEPDKAVRA